MTQKNLSQPESGRILIDKRKAAELLSICVRTLERLMAEKKLPYVRLTPGTVRFRVSDLEAYVEQRIINRKAMERTSIFLENERKEFGMPHR